MILGRRSDTAVDGALITALLGLASLVDQLRAVVAELVADGDRSEPGEPVPDDVVDVVLGLVALADAAARHLPADRGEPVAPEDADEPGALAMRELLR